ncbi:hypothetical protein [Amycolatopsis jiangsuensis]|uniref:3-methyladenine DNA glycosylase AlkC n=1 Tax=Amycolatopsis jiangsuensis TaxID=1181879 RepID=A0A840IZM0_9PSEU|nr:hypothetical protein [Amycolatopsis jiangsuensis]MBB4686334.1 3-methyladenine DNA glycosylase AlkC [Amycolatopsis jiangsuensis]
MPFADDLVGPGVVAALVAAVHRAAPHAPLRALLDTTAALPPLALRERGRLVRDALLADLPGSYPSFAATMRAARELSPSFTGWLVWPVTSAVAAKAVQDGSAGAFDDALALLAEFTSLLTSEFALRGLLRHDLDRGLAVVGTWAGHDSQDVRRLAAEGTRPLLPWAERVPRLLAEPYRTRPILDALHDDGSEYVRRSVAAHLSDVARRDPDLAVATAAAWLDRPTAEVARIAAHGLRGLVRQGHPGAVALLSDS